jgi:hemerythrin
MPLFQWSEKFSVNCEEMDHQHRRLFSLMGTFDAALREDGNVGQIRAALEEFIGYAEFHLREEEKLMKRINYPTVDDHLVRHRYFSVQVDLMKSVCLSNRLPLARSIIRFMGVWLGNHIYCDDRKYGAFLESRNPGPVQRESANY